MDHCLIELLRYQVLNGNKVSDEFMAKALIEMVTDGKFGLTVTKMLWGIDTKHLRKQHNDTKVLLEHSGLSWGQEKW